MGSWFSSGNSDNTTLNKNNNYANVINLKINNNTPPSQIQRKYESEILGKIRNIYVQRHAVSCANTIEKVFGKGQNEKTKYAYNSGISYVGVQQCLQVSDYFSNFRIDDNPNSKNGKKPLIIFCCSELTRTHQTLFLSWIKYLKDYKANNGKIVVLPWLNEVSLPKIRTLTYNKDNYPSSLADTKQVWEKFIKNLRENSNRIKADTLNHNSELDNDINGISNSEFWDELFYLSPIIFKQDGDPLSNKGKETPINRVMIHTKMMGSMKQLFKLFKKIIAKYLIDRNIYLDKYDGIELVLVAHHNSAEHLMKFLMPSTEEQFNKQQLVNCEVVRLPGACLEKPGDATSNLIMERIFPTKFNKVLNIQINSNIVNVKKEGKLLKRKRKTYVNPLFILYMSELNLFFSVNNIVRTKLKARFVEGTGMEAKNYESDERVEVEKPLSKFLFNLSLEEYLSELQYAQQYIRELQTVYEEKPTFYNYKEMDKKINEKIGFLRNYFSSVNFKNKKFQQEQKIQLYIENKKKNNKNITFTQKEIQDKLKDYLFGFCGLDKTAIDSIAVF